MQFRINNTLVLETLTKGKDAYVIEIIIFVAFVGLQTVFHTAPEVAKKVEHRKIAEKARKHQYIVWIFHPTIVHAVQDYLVHFVIYSGHIIAAH